MDVDPDNSQKQSSSENNDSNNVELLANQCNITEESWPGSCNLRVCIVLMSNYYVAQGIYLWNSPSLLYLSNNCEASKVQIIPWMHYNGYMALQLLVVLSGIYSLAFSNVRSATLLGLSILLQFVLHTYYVLSDNMLLHDWELTLLLPYICWTYLTLYIVYKYSNVLKSENSIQITTSSNSNSNANSDISHTQTFMCLCLSGMLWLSWFVCHALLRGADNVYGLENIFDSVQFLEVLYVMLLFYAVVLWLCGMVGLVGVLLYHSMCASLFEFGLLVTSAVTGCYFYFLWFTQSPYCIIWHFACFPTIALFVFGYQYTFFYFLPLEPDLFIFQFLKCCSVAFKISPD
ncbi:hypothetical protein RFI_03068 [Reticulomyxa filosa]|uniref:Uncharacterized protein n=1 Tax=Reticulomyxa filosa TaxID=46433 RepID=X6P744_RETFI|nr:hypothetical protein RFI_03068 [Reticulomyxa filosa]|eukprot:ETO34026.1 hypothetical protein RFI_03068 [Reticulomyxa filosa]